MRTTRFHLPAALALSVLLLFGAGSIASAAPRAETDQALIDEAIKLVADFEDAKAADLLNAVLRRDPSAAVAGAAHLYLGLIALNALDTDRARLEFKLALKNDPTVELPFDASPKARVGFEEARKELLEELPRKSRSTPRLNDLVSQGPKPPQASAPPLLPPSDDDWSPNHTRSIVVASAGAAVLIGGLVAGLLANNSLASANNSDTPIQPALSFARTAGTEGLAADVCFVAGGAAVVVGAVLFVLEARSPPPARKRALDLEAGKATLRF